MKHRLIASLLALALASSPFVQASSHSSSKGSSSKGAKTSKSKPSKPKAVKKSKSENTSKTVHVKSYTKKDGTQVDAYDRKAPTKKGGVTTAGQPAPQPTPTPEAAKK